MSNVLALIPARSGSKGIPDKNIRLLQGKPLLAHSIEHALQAQTVTRTIVSTDSAHYAEIARQYGAETPFLRPAEISQDLSTDLEAFEHALGWLRTREGYAPDICVHLRPTYPARKAEDIDNMVRMLLDRPDVDSARSVTPAPETPFKMWFRDEEGLLTPVVHTEIRDAHNLPRQGLPPAYLQNACIDVVRTRVILDQGSMTGRRILGYVMAENLDIDTELQLAVVRERIEGGAAADGAKENGADTAPHPRRTYCFDIDGVIASLTPDNEYGLAEPLRKTIATINTLYDQGHYIILFTARGSMTGIDWSEVTARQMAEWGVKYHELRFGKPAADYYVDDKMLSINDLYRRAGQPGSGR